MGKRKKWAKQSSNQSIKIFDAMTTSAQRAAVVKILSDGKKKQLRTQNLILIKMSNQIFIVLCDMVAVDLNTKIFEKLKKILVDNAICKSL